MPIETVYTRVERLEETTIQLLYKNLAILRQVYCILSEGNPHKEAVYNLILEAEKDLRERL